MWVPLVPPPAPIYRQVMNDDTGIVGMRAALSYSTEWLMDLRVLTDPREETTDRERWVVQLCAEGAWYDLDRHGIEPTPTERVVASVQLVFLIETPGLAT